MNVCRDIGINMEHHILFGPALIYKGHFHEYTIDMDTRGITVIKPFPVAAPDEIMVQMHPAFKGQNRKSYEVLYKEGAQAYMVLTMQYRALERSYTELSRSMPRSNAAVCPTNGSKRAYLADQPGTAPMPRAPDTVSAERLVDCKHFPL